MGFLLMENMTKLCKWIVAVACLAVLAAIPASTQAKQGKDIALLLKVRGEVSINRGANGSWEAAKKGMRLHSGNVIRTGDNSLAAIVFTDDKSLIKVRENSELTIRGKREARSVRKSIFMRLGELWARVTGGSNFQVETPSGVAAVKGTEFYVTMDATGNMVVFCLEGLIELMNRLGRVNLNPGDRGEVLRDQLPTKRRSRPDEVPQWGGADEDLNELQIEFEDEDGNKKILKIRFK